jgi:chemotaxis protein CheC
MKLSAVQADAIQELGNIGAAHAATTLSTMLSSTVSMSVPAIKAIDLADLGNHIGDESAAMVVFELQGEIQHGGYIFLYHQGISYATDQYYAGNDRYGT